MGTSAARLASGALAVCVLVVAAPATATFPGTNGEIVSQTFKNRQTLTATVDAGARTELAIEGRYPSFSPDGATLAYSCGKDICAADADGTNERVLAKAPAKTKYRWPGFSRDGDAIVFVAGKGTLSLMRANGTRVRTIPKAGDAWQPEFSAASDKIVFSRKDGKRRSIYSIKPNGRGLARITKAPRGLADINPSIAPNGRLIAFERIKDGGSSPDQVWVVESDGDNPKRLAGQGADVLAATPAFSPDGTLIAFSFNDLNDEIDNYSLWTMNPDGTGQTQLNPEPALQPTWRPLP